MSPDFEQWKQELVGQLVVALRQHRFSEVWQLNRSGQAMAEGPGAECIAGLT